MFCIDNRRTDIHFNLAAEEYLLKFTRESYLLLWQSEPSVVIGKYQSVRAETDEEFIRSRQISLARRISGGGAVYHDDGNLNLTFIETAEQPDFNRYLQAVAESLKTMGILTQADARQGLYLGGGKISGSAQCVHKDRVLYHCTLLFDTDLQQLNNALEGTSPQGSPPGPGKAAAVRSVHSPVVNIGHHLPERMDINRFRELLFAYFLNLDKANRRYDLVDDQTAAINRLKTGKYATREWIYNSL